MSEDDNTLAETPGEVETETKVEGEKPETEQAEAKPEEGQDTGKTEGEEKPKRIPGSRREKIKNDILLQEKRELERRLEEAERRLPKSDGAVDPKDKEPQEADFNGDYFAYERAMNAHNMRKIIREETSANEASKRAKEQGDVWREHLAAHQERIEDAKEVITDFDQVLASAKGVDVTVDVQKELLSSDKSALLVYYLAKNPDKLQALNGMTGRELAREIGRLEGSVRMPAAKKQTTAPSPLTTLRGGASPSFDPTKASMDEYVAKRKAGWTG